MSIIAELFEKILHPTRIKILTLLQDEPLNFSQLKAALNIESNGRKLVWVMLSILALIALGFTSQSLIYALIEKANGRIRKAQTSV